MAAIDPRPRLTMAEIAADADRHDRIFLLWLVAATIAGSVIWGFAVYGFIQALPAIRAALALF